MLAVSQAEFARMRDVSKKTVTVWKQQGRLVLTEDGLVDVGASDKSLAERPPLNRGGAVKRNGNTPANGNGSTLPPQPLPAGNPAESDDDGPLLDASPEEIAAKTNWTHAEAARVKETYLAHLRKQEFEVNAGKLIERAVAERTFFDTARDNRDAWLSWPARVSTLMASELGVDAAVLTTVLNRYVQQHLAEQGEPDEFSAAA